MVACIGDFKVVLIVKINLVLPVYYVFRSTDVIGFCTLTVFMIYQEGITIKIKCACRDMLNKYNSTFRGFRDFIYQYVQGQGMR